MWFPQICSITRGHSQFWLVKSLIFDGSTFWEESGTGTAPWCFPLGIGILRRKLWNMGCKLFAERERYSKALATWTHICNYVCIYIYMFTCPQGLRRRCGALTAVFGSAPVPPSLGGDGSPPFLRKFLNGEFQFSCVLWSKLSLNVLRA